MQRFLAIVVGVLVVGAAVLYFMLERRYQASFESARAAEARALEDQLERSSVIARELAEDAVRVLAASAGDLVFVGQADRLETLLAGAVQGHRLVGVMVLDPNGVVLSSTDLRYRGRVLDDPETRAALAATSLVVARTAPVPGRLEIDAPLMAAGERIGALRAFVQLDELAGS